MMKQNRYLYTWVLKRHFLTGMISVLFILMLGAFYYFGYRHFAESTLVPPSGPAATVFHQANLRQMVEVLIFSLLSFTAIALLLVYLKKSFQLKQQLELREMERKLNISEEKCLTIIDTIEDGYFETDLAGAFIYVNDAECRILGYSREELIGMNNRRYQDETTAKELYQLFHQIYMTGQSVKAYDVELKRKDGAPAFHEISVALIRDVQGNPVGFRGISRDVTERKKAEQALKKAEQSFQSIVMKTLTGILILDDNGIVKFANPAAKALFNDQALEGAVFGLPAVDQVNDSGAQIEIIRGDGRIGYAELRTVQTQWNGEDVVLVMIFDITEHREMEEKLKFLSLRDALTSLYNRYYFEEEMRRLDCGRFNPVGMVVCDVDGLKIVNDYLGHAEGDKLLQHVSAMMRSVFRENDVIARVGGDEFAILLPSASASVVEAACGRLKDYIREQNTIAAEIPVSLSVGYAVKADQTLKISDAYKEADNNMYKEKVRQSAKGRIAILRYMVKNMEGRNIIATGRTDRLKKILGRLAARLGLDGQTVDVLYLLAEFDDIGNIGIPANIMDKPGSLTEEEQREMRRHVEIGYHLAATIPKLITIAEGILKHHEWWNGGGYPTGIKEKDIPLECRLLSIAEAYDAMTHDRPHHKAFTDDEAKAELIRWAGTQFDPELVKIFLAVMEEQPLESSLPPRPSEEEKINLTGIIENSGKAHDAAV